MAKREGNGGVTWSVLLMAVAGLVEAAAGQNSWFFEVQYSDPAGVIDSPDDTATVSLWAAWDAKYYAFYYAEVDLTANDPIDSGTWLKSRTMLRGDGSSDGTIEDERVAGVIPLQLQFGPDFADTSNPILTWQGTWCTSDLRQRNVPVFTESLNFSLYIDINGYFDSVFDSLEEGSGVVRVVPEPAIVPMFVVCIACAARSRRR